MTDQHGTESQLAWDIREKFLPLPPKSPDSEYKRLFFVGKTGAGKTTLLRQFLGINPTKHSFPPTSSSRTTTADFEAILTEFGSEYKCIATFFKKDFILGHIKDCLFDSAKSFSEKSDFDKAYDNFLEHKKQVFRLKYMIGDFRKLKNKNQYSHLYEIISKNGRKYKKYIEILSENIRKKGSEVLKILFDGKSYEDLSSENKSEYNEYIFSDIVESEYFVKCCDGIIDDILNVFNEATKHGKVEKDCTGWPKTFFCTARNENSFMEIVRKFCSNDASEHGSLVSPIVNGMRISGPFCPLWNQRAIPKIIILDGQGVGHTVDRQNILSTPTSITDNFYKVDSIVLVDTAPQPMLDGTASILSSVITHGYSEDLIFAFTKFDQIEGTDIVDEDDKKQRVTAPIRNFAATYVDDKSLGIEAQDILCNIPDRKFIFLSSIDKIVDNNNDQKIPLQNLLNVAEVSFFPRRAPEQLKNDITNKDTNNTQTHHSKQIHNVSKSVHDKSKNEIKKNNQINKQSQVKAKENNTALNFIGKYPTLVDLGFDKTKLSVGLLKAVKIFHEKWDALLNHGSPSREPAEHWTRIKALNRRISEYNLDSYDTLAPVADITRFVQDAIFKYTTQYLCGNKFDQKLKNEILKKCSNRLALSCRPKIISTQRQRWDRANNFSGKGSTRCRADEIREIYLNGVPPKNESELISTIVKLIQNEIEKAFHVDHKK